MKLDNEILVFLSKMYHQSPNGYVTFDQVREIFQTNQKKRLLVLKVLDRLNVLEKYGMIETNNGSINNQYSIRITDKGTASVTFANTTAIDIKL